MRLPVSRKTARKLNEFHNLWLRLFRPAFIWRITEYHKNDENSHNKINGGGNLVSWKSWIKDHRIKYHQIKDHRIKELIQSHYNLILHILHYIMLHIHHVVYVVQNCPIILNFIQGLLSAIVTFNSTTPNQNETNEKIYVGHSFYCIWWLPKEPSTFSSPDSRLPL